MRRLCESIAVQSIDIIPNEFEAARRVIEQLVEAVGESHVQRIQ
jgi:hypothetical protein